MRWWWRLAGGAVKASHFGLIALLVTGNWVLSEMVTFTQNLFESLPRLLDRT